MREKVGGCDAKFIPPHVIDLHATGYIGACVYFV